MSAGGYLDGCGFIPVSTGTGDFVVSAAVTGYQTPASASAVNATVYTYRAESADKSQWEIGFGAYTVSSTTLARTTVLASSNSGSKTSFSAAPNVYVTAAKADLQNASLLTGGTVAPSLLSLSQITSSLSADVSLSNTSNYFDGPSVAQGSSGTWFCSGTITCNSTSGSADAMQVKLWDGTTVISSTAFHLTAAGSTMSCSLSGFIASPAGNLRISVNDASSTGGKILFNNSGLSKDSTITAFRLK